MPATDTARGQPAWLRWCVATAVLTATPPVSILLWLTRAVDDLALGVILLATIAAPVCALVLLHLLQVDRSGSTAGRTAAFAVALGGLLLPPALVVAFMAALAHIHD
jgi:hypothetical protein